MKVTINVEVASQEEANSVVAKIFGGAAPATGQFNAAPLGAQSHDDEEEGTGTDGSGVDKNGLPWDERIHSSNKKMTAKGVWTRRKGVTDDVFEQVAAQLRAPALTQQPAPQQYAQAPQHVPHVPHVPQQPAPQQYAQAPVHQPHVPQQQDLSQIPAHMQAQPQQYAQAPQQYAQAPQHVPHVPQQPVASQGQTFGDLFNKIQSLFAQGTDPNYVISLQQRLGHQFGVQINSINDISNRADIVAAAFTLLAQDGK